MEWTWVENRGRQPPVERTRERVVGTIKWALVSNAGADPTEVDALYLKGEVWWGYAWVASWNAKTGLSLSNLGVKKRQAVQEAIDNLHL